MSDINPLKPGKTYKIGPDGTYTEVDPPVSEKVVEVPDEDLPPDMRAGAVKEPPAQKPAEKGPSDPQIPGSLSALQDVLRLPPVSVSKEERQAFLRALVSGQPYMKQFSLFGGSIKATFKTLSTEELDAVSEAIVIQSGRVPYSSMLAMAGAHMRFTMACSLTQVSRTSDDGIVLQGNERGSVLTDYRNEPRKDSYYVKPRDKDRDAPMRRVEETVTPTPGHKVIWAAIDRFKDLQVPVYNALYDCYRKFDAEVIQMTGEASDPSFFQDGVDGPYS